MGGEKCQSRFFWLSSRGSPPRGRGKGRRVVNHHPLPGITPAWAGNRPERLSYLSRCFDHPRMGGEQTVKVPALVVPTGSPPRRRGKESSLQASLPTGRITPAWAGKSDFGHPFRCCRWDHPRMGGEKQHQPQGQEQRKGSPPHGRGKESAVVFFRKFMGITPA